MSKNRLEILLQLFPTGSVLCQSRPYRFCYMQCRRFTSDGLGFVFFLKHLIYYIAGIIKLLVVASDGYRGCIAIYLIHLMWSVRYVRNKTVNACHSSPFSDSFTNSYSIVTVEQRCYYNNYQRSNKNKNFFDPSRLEHATMGFPSSSSNCVTVRVLS